ncbi:MAG: hypothetical protein ACR2GU_09385 [Rubrobacteraceae bacterium]
MEERAEPKPGRPRTEESYGIPANEERLLSWGHLSHRMAGARNYWISTVKTDGNYPLIVGNAMIRCRYHRKG